MGDLAMWAAELEVEEDMPDESGPVPRAHVSVLLQQCVDALAPRAGGVYVDATYGAGGHTEALLQANDAATVIGIDRDETALSLHAERVSRFGDRVRLVHGSFSSIEQILDQLGIQQVDGLLADLGVSSMQLDEPDRGMSFRADGPLDMRMDRTTGMTALELIEATPQEELANLIYNNGEERRSRRVARCIKLALADGRLHTTLDLRKAIVRATGPARVGGVDPATRTFQALRIAVNGELDQLKSLLDAATRVVAPGGVLAVMSFHSLEDRLVKRAFQNRGVWEPLWKKPLGASASEMQENPRARSAKLRAARRRAPDSEPDTDSAPDSEPESET